MGTPKKLGCVLLCLLMLLCTAGAAQAAPRSQTTGTLQATEIAEAALFPFLAETNELAVNVRSQISTKSTAVGRLERGQQLTVISAQTDAQGELWYAVELEDGTTGYIRGDLLITAEEAEAERAASPDAKERQYIGNRKTKKFHLPSCYTLPDEKNQTSFSSREEAVSNGYVPCKKCNP